MAIDPNLILQSVASSKTPYIDPAESGLRQQQIRTLGIQNQTNALNLQRAQQMMQLAQNADFSSPEGWQNYTSQVAKFDPKAAQELAKSNLETQKAFHEAQNLKLEQATKARQYVGQVIGSVQDQNSYDTALAHLRGYAASLGDKDLLKELQGAPDTYDPAFVAREHNAAMTGVQQTEAAWKANQQRLEQLKLDEEGRHNRAMEAKPNMAQVVIGMGGNGGGGADPSQALSPGEEALAQAIAQKRQAPMVPSTRQPFANRINARAAYLGGGQLTGSADVAAEQGALKSFEPGGTNGQTITALNTAVDHMAILRQAAQKLQNGDIQAANRFGNALGIQFGNNEATNFNVVKGVLASEIAKVNGAGVVTDSNRKEAADMFPVNGSNAQIAGALDMAQRLMGGKLNALDVEHRRLYGKSLAQAGRLTPAASSAFQGASEGVPAQGGTAQAAGTVQRGGKTYYLHSDGNYYTAPPQR